MGTTNNTSGSNSSTLQFNPISQGIYNSMTKGAGNVMNGYINSPFSNPFYNMGAAQSQKGAQAAGANNMAALNQSQLVNGMGGQAGAGFMNAQRAQTGRANQAMSSQANQSNIFAALQRQMQAAGTGLSYSPQLTGQSGNFSQTSSTGGLGSWLPQVMGAGLSMAGMAASGGMSGMAQFGGGSVGGVSNPSLGTPGFMPGGGNILPPSFAGSNGMSGALPGYMPMQPPTVSPFLNMYGQN